MKIFYALLATLIVMGCPIPEPKPPVVNPDASQDASEDAMDSSLRYPVCAKACEKLAILGCPEAMPMDAGKSCYLLCADATESKKFDLKPACIADSKSIDDVKACGTVRCK